jgi:hypothetical protein
MVCNIDHKRIGVLNQRIVSHMKAAKFRCDILRSFIQSPDTGNKFSKVTFTTGIEQTCTSFLTQVCTDLVDRAISGGTARFIQDPLPDSARAELIELWIRAAHLFTQLHTQMSTLFWGTHQFLGQGFNAKMMNKHSCHPRDAETHCEIHLMLFPCIAICENYDRQKYHNRRIISKGTVLVGPVLRKR